MNRRSALLLGGSLLLAAPAQAQPTLPLLDGDMMADSTEIVPLWPAKPPGDLGTPRTLTITERSKEPGRYHDRSATGISIPDLTIYRPSHPDGSAILLMPGGG